MRISGVIPKLAVRTGDKVKVGDALFFNKACPDVRFASPVSGEVTEIARGERRRVLHVKIKADSEQEFLDFGKKDVSALNGDTVKKSLTRSRPFRMDKSIALCYINYSRYKA